MLLYIADDFKVLDDGKQLAIGLYTDRVLVLRVHVDVPPPTEDKPYALRVCLLACITNPPTDRVFDVESRIETPGGAVLQRMKGTIGPVAAGAAANLLMRFEQFIIPQAGTYKYLLSIDGGPDDFEQFEVRVVPSDDEAHKPTVLSRVTHQGVDRSPA